MTDSLRILSQKLFDNSIDAKEINDLIEKFSIDKYFETNFFMDLTHLFFKDFSNAVASANSINQILPKFNILFNIPNFVLFQIYIIFLVMKKVKTTFTINYIC